MYYLVKGLNRGSGSSRLQSSGLFKMMMGSHPTKVYWTAVTIFMGSYRPRQSFLGGANVVCIPLTLSVPLGICPRLLRRPRFICGDGRYFVCQKGNVHVNTFIRLTLREVLKIPFCKTLLIWQNEN